MCRQGGERRVNDPDRPEFPDPVSGNSGPTSVMVAHDPNSKSLPVLALADGWSGPDTHGKSAIAFMGESQFLSPHHRNVPCLPAAFSRSRLSEAASR